MNRLLPAGAWLEAMNAELLGSETALEEVTRVVTDSRDAGPATLFAALAGERVNGWDYLDAALELGGRAFLGPKAAAAFFKDILKKNLDASFLLVDDPVLSLHAAAARYRRLHPEALRIGVTGSQGKTGVKEMLRTVLASDGPTIATEGNRNSVISLPGEIFRIGETTRYAVLEMGIDHPGEMDVMAETFQPQVAVITAIGTAHAGQLGGRDGIAKEKKRIVSRMGDEGVLVAPRSDDYFDFLTRDFRGTVLAYSETDIEESLQVESWNRTSFLWKGERVALPVGGRHHARNALAALTLAGHLGLDAGKAAGALASLELPTGRGRWLPGPVSVFDDSYNANPQSMSALFDLVGEVRGSGGLHLVLGAMKELGSLSDSAHVRMGTAAAGLGSDSLVFVGNEAKLSCQAAEEAGYKGFLVWVPDAGAALEQLSGRIREGDTVVLKASRSVALDRIGKEIQRRMERAV